MYHQNFCIKKCTLNWLCNSKLYCLNETWHKRNFRPFISLLTPSFPLGAKRDNSSGYQRFCMFFMTMPISLIAKSQLHSEQKKKFILVKQLSCVSSRQNESYYSETRFYIPLPSRIVSVVIILQPLIPNVAAGTRSYFQFICTSVHLSGPAFFHSYINRSI